MGPPKRPVSRELPSRDPFLIDVPADGSCLFWSTALAYLIPVKDDNDAFQQRYTTLFEDEKFENCEDFRQLIDSCLLYNRITSNEKVKGLIDKFRNKVADYISSDAELRGAVNKDNILCLFDNQNRQEEIICETVERNLGLCSNGRDIKNRKAIIQELLNNKEKNEANNLVSRVYLECVRNNQFWGGELEIEAMSKMLKAEINVFGSTRSQYPGGDIPIQLFHVSTIEGGERNH
ncbi:phosphocholine transferase AnkX [Trichonephila clavata]|uniref:Phosphocholine transferase AnkX n=1 Tax=Trichonephila clavata TaxID=2740835 RepID=A0A8X6LLC6_TRICU|nr:phosphocholine transferase AnkX [Trichonephila clavata]